MSYQGWASGTLTVHSKDSDQRQIASDCIEEESAQGCLHPFPPERIAYAKKGFNLEAEFDSEIRYYFGDNLEELIAKLRERIPGIRVTGAFWMYAENDTSTYRMEVDSTRHDSPLTESESVDWLMQYSCSDMDKIHDYVKKNFKRDPIA
jgi:hypothetical protein